MQLDAPQIESAYSGTIDILGVLGRGAQGSTFLAETDRGRVALKVCPPNDDFQSIKRAAREAEKLALVDSDHVVKLLHHGELQLGDEWCAFLELEYIEGKSTEEFVGKWSGQQLDDELQILLHHVGQAIDALWEQYILHRDVKPANILRRSGGGYVLLDLGLAKTDGDYQLTASGGQPGTNGFLSPERFDGKNLSKRADYFALGVTAYQVATGKLPFGREDPRTVGAPPPLSDVGVGSEVSDCVERLLSFKTFDRPRDVDQFFGKGGS